MKECPLVNIFVCLPTKANTARTDVEMLSVSRQWWGTRQLGFGLIHDAENQAWWYIYRNVEHKTDEDGMRQGGPDITANPSKQQEHSNSRLSTTFLGDLQWCQLQTQRWANNVVEGSNRLRRIRLRKDQCTNSKHIPCQTRTPWASAKQH